jgi:hypothetical protein
MLRYTIPGSYDDKLHKYFNRKNINARCIVCRRKAIYFLKDEYIEYANKRQWQLCEIHAANRAEYLKIKINGSACND